MKFRLKFVKFLDPEALKRSRYPSRTKHPLICNRLNVLMLNFWRKSPEGSPLRKCDKDLKLEFGNSKYILWNKNLTSIWLPWTCESRFRFYGYLKLRDNDILPIQIIIFSFINDKCSCKTVILWKSSRCSHVKYIYLYNPPWVTSRKFVNTVRHVTAIKPMKRALHTKFIVT